MAESPTLMVYGASARGDAALRDAARAGGPLAVVALAAVERPRRACCGIQSGVWNRLQREMAESDLARARPRGSATTTRSAPSAAAWRAIARSGRTASKSSTGGLGRRALRRLRRRCPVPVLA
jgi:hypothetical protein